jgi:hypothetical protein
MSSRQQRIRRRTIRAAGDEATIRFEAAGGIDWIQALADGEGKPKGPPKFSMLAYTGGPMTVGYYGSPVVLDMAGGVTPNTVPILLNHDLKAIVGHSEAAEKGPDSLKLSGVISGAGPAAAEVAASARNGFPWKASVGARPDKLEFVGEGVATQVNGKTFRGPLYVARKWTLGEVSFVAVAADGRTSAKVAATAAAHTPPSERNQNMNFDQWVKALGFDAATLTDAQKAALQAKYDAELKAAAAKQPTDIAAGGNGTPPKQPAVEPPKFDVHAVGLAYARHEAQIEAKAAEYAGKIDAAELAKIAADGRKAAMDLRAKALGEEWPATRLEVEAIKAQTAYEVALIRAERPKGPAIHAAGNAATDLKVIEAAFRMQLAAPEKTLIEAYGAETLERAHRFRAVRLREMVAICCALDHREAPPIGASQAEVIRAGFSSASLPTLLSNVGHKTMLDSYKAVASVAAVVARKLTATDFKTHTGVRLTGDFTMQEVGATGELEHAAVADDSFTYAIKTYGRIFGLTRQMFINDDLGAFAEIPRMIGRGAALTREQLFWTLVLANTGDFFHANNANLITAALGSAGLGTAAAALENQTDSDGNPVLIMGKYLAVPPALRVTAEELFKAQNLVVSSATKQPNVNIWGGRYEPQVSPYLSNTSFHANASATQWYLFGDPADVAAFGIAYLHGAENPVVEEAELSAEFLGKAWRGYIDLGVCQIDHRGAVKSTGAG